MFNLDNRKFNIDNRKRELITAILAQDTYMPDSGMYQQLVKALMKLSHSDLLNLNLLIDLKGATHVREATC